MTIEDLVNQEEMRESQYEFINNQIAKEVLQKFLITTNYSYNKENGYDIGLEDLFYCYALVKNTKEQVIFDNLLIEYSFNYIPSIHNALYYLLGKKREISSQKVDVLSWPGMKEITKDKDKYIIDTNIGTIEVFKASRLLSKNNPYIFSKDLMGHCDERTYEFIKRNNEYKAVLTYTPSFFEGGMYHTYLESEDNIIDIAANALYHDKKYAISLKGEIIAKLTFDESEKLFSKLNKEIPELYNNNSKLRALTLYLDSKKLY